MSNSKQQKIFIAMTERGIANPLFSEEDGAIFNSIAEYEGVTGQQFPYKQEEYERYCS